MIIILIPKAYANIIINEEPRYYETYNDYYDLIEKSQKFNLISLRLDTENLSEYIAYLNKNTEEYFKYGTISLRGNLIVKKDNTEFIDQIELNYFVLYSNINRIDLSINGKNVLTYNILNTSFEGEYYFDLNEYYESNVECRLVRTFDFYIPSYEISDIDLSIFNYNIFYGIYYYFDDECNIYTSNFTDINNIINNIDILDNENNRINNYSVMYINNNDNNYNIRIYSKTKLKEYVIKDINIYIVNMDDYIIINNINIDYLHTLSEDEIINNYLILKKDFNKIELISLYKYLSHIPGDYKLNIKAYDESNNLYLINTNIIVKDLNKPKIIPKYSFKSIKASNNQLLDLDYINSLFNIYEISDYKIEIIGYDNYKTNYNVVNTYPISYKVIDSFNNINEYKFDIDVLDTNTYYIDTNYYINIDINNRLSKYDIQELLIQNGYINNIDLIEMESDYFKSSDSGIYDLYVKDNNDIYLYKLNVNGTNNKIKSKSSDSYVYVITTIVLFSVIVIIFVLGRKIYEKTH